MVIGVLAGCVTETEPSWPGVSAAEGYVPVYGDRASADIKLGSSRTLADPGKIYTYKNFLFVNERNKGVHVFNNEDLSKPQPVAFIEILGNHDVAIKDDIMYADHNGNIVSLKLNELKSLELLGTLPLSGFLLGIPPPSGSYFECIDSEKGLVVAWKKETLANPNCYAF